RERVLDRLALERVGAARSERLVRLHQQHARADALEDDQAAAAAGAAVEADVVGAETCGQTGGEQELGVEPRDLDEQGSAALVPVEREVAVDLLHAARARLDRRNRSARCGCLSAAAAAAAGLLRGERLRSMSGQHQDHEGEYDAEGDGCS